MRLSAWFKLTGTKRLHFADKLGVAAPTVTRIERGEQNIPLSLVDRVVENTSGAVTANDLHAAYVEARSARA